MGVDIKKLQDIINLTRATEIQKGSWVSLASDLADYPLHSALIPRTVKRSSFRYEWTVMDDQAPDDAAEYSSVNKPLQTAVVPQSRRLGIDLAKIRRAISFARDERELQGTEEEELVDLVLARKAEKLDLKLLSFMEHKLAGKPSSGATSEQELYGLQYWFPSKSSATAVEMNGGGNPADFATGAADLPVATVPRWAHAVAGFTKVSDDDLFDKLHEFRIRVNYYTPDGVVSLDAGMPNRCILVQHPTFLEWARVQTAANDDLRSDVGIWRNAISFMGTPVKWLPVISTPGSPETPTDHGLLYDLDLNTIRLMIHSAFNFDLETADKADVPGVVQVWREGYAQLACVNREKNLVARTSNTDLIVS